MKLFTALALLLGLALLGWLLYETDLEAALDLLTRIGIWGALAIMAVFAASFGAEIIAWALTFTRPVTLPWLGGLWNVNMVGEALSVVMPFGALGGEPFKALLLNRHYGVPYGESTASLLIVQTMFAAAQAPFVLVGLVLVLASGLLSEGVELAMTFAAIGLTLFMVLVLVAIRLRWLAALARRLARSGRGARLVDVIAMLNDVEYRLFSFIRNDPKRFAFFFLNWVIGAVEIWVILHLMGSSVSFWDCWIIEAAVVLIRSATFFVPAHIGSLEAATVYVTAALTGSTDLGLALALARRARELGWSAIGLAIGGIYALKKPQRKADA
jgi:uncharacterized membrane protein YbhN (UPF0104 family)